MTIYHSVYYANELSRRHSLNDSEKLASALADAQVDLNPHQLDAALFAFRSPLSKGSLLADEVGLGKTIEAGLIIAQKWAERKRKILIITPANLRKQWSLEMADKFYIPSCILEQRNFKTIQKAGTKNPFEQDLLVLCSYQFAAKHSQLVMTQPWDLVVVDEAHRLRNVYKPDNKIAKKIKMALMNRPKILLTATPLQNSLLELYGIVSIIDDYAFGDYQSFKAKYSRLTSEDSFDELKKRLTPICHRTLRRQVLEYIKFTNRIPLTEDFYPTQDEMALYDMVTEYLQKESLYALPKSQRQLITLILRKLLASSTFAIAGALNTLAARLKKVVENAEPVDELPEIEDDYDSYEDEKEERSATDELLEEEEPEEEPHKLTREDIKAIQEEITELEEFRDVAKSITVNSKGQALLSALAHGFKKAVELGSAEKAVVFTESRKTQNYLVQLLSENGYEGKIVLFNGTNSDALSNQIYQKWVERFKNSDKVTGSKTADMRAAIVEHFRDGAQVMIATEAGAEGINLQFCSIVVNYDLPWNPQRIEQRIGRCHRYGQKHDVVVINFINRKNAADRRVYELLDQKFKLFSGVFGASDEVLGVIESGIEFEKRIAEIYQTCRTADEIEAGFEVLQRELEEKITATMSDARTKLLENFDADVQDRLRVNLSQSRDYLSKIDHMLWSLTKHSLEGVASFNDEKFSFVLQPGHSLGKDIPSGTYILTREELDCHRYRVGHTLAQKLIGGLKEQTPAPGELTLDYSGWGKQSENIKPLIGKRGTLSLYRLSINGADEQDHLYLCASTEKGQVLPEETARRLLDLPVKGTKAQDLSSAMGKKGVSEIEAKIASDFQKRKKKLLNELSKRQAVWFDDEMGKLNFWASDKRKGLKAELKDYDDQIALLKKEARQTSNLPEKLAVQKKLRDLDKKRDMAWKKYDEAAKMIEKEKDELLDKVEGHLKQTTEEKRLYTLDWEIV